MRTPNLLIKKLGFLAAAAMITLSACQKKDANVTTNTPGPAHSLRLTPDDAANSANPFDYMGLAHNEALQATRAVWTNSSSTFHDIYTSSTTFIRTNYDPHVVASPERDVENTYYTVKADMPNYGATLIAATPLSATGKTYANNIMQILLRPNTTATYMDLKNAVVAVEVQVAGDRNLSTADKQALSKIASVGRYSTLYWVNESAGLNRTGTPLLTTNGVTTPVAAQTMGFNWIGAVMADVGAIMGEIGSGHSFWQSVVTVVCASLSAGFGL